MSTATPTRPSAARERILDTAFAALLRPGHPRRRGRPDHRRVRRGQGDVLQALPRQGRPGRRLPRQGRRRLDRPAARRRRGGRPGPGRPAGRPLRRLGTRAGATATAAAPSSTPRPSRSRAPRSTTGRWRTRTRCSPGCATSPSRPARADPEALARSLTLLLDGGLASGALDAAPEAPEVARRLRRRPGGGRHRRVRLSRADTRPRLSGEGSARATGPGDARAATEVGVVADVGPLPRARERGRQALALASRRARRARARPGAAGRRRPARRRAGCASPSSLPP